MLSLIRWKILARIFIRKTYLAESGKNVCLQKPLHFQIFQIIQNKKQTKNE